MIRSADQAVAVQARRRQAGLKGRSKAVRRWFKREYGQAVEAHGGPVLTVLTVPGSGSPRRQIKFEADLRKHLDGDFTGCRRFDEVHK